MSHLWTPEQHDQHCPARQGGECIHEEGCKASSAAQDRLFVNDERTVLVRIWASGTVEVARREAPDHVWGPPVYVVEEQA